MSDIGERLGILIQDIVVVALVLFFISGDASAAEQKPKMCYYEVQLEIVQLLTELEQTHEEAGQPLSERQRSEIAIATFKAKKESHELEYCHRGNRYYR